MSRPALSFLALIILGWSSNVAAFDHFFILKSGEYTVNDEFDRNRQYLGAAKDIFGFEYGRILTPARISLGTDFYHFRYRYRENNVRRAIRSDIIMFSLKKHFLGPQGISLSVGLATGLNFGYTESGRSLFNTDYFGRAHKITLGINANFKTGGIYSEFFQLYSRPEEDDDFNNNATEDLLTLTGRGFFLGYQLHF